MKKHLKTMKNANEFEVLGNKVVCEYIQGREDVISGMSDVISDTILGIDIETFPKKGQSNSFLPATAKIRCLQVYDGERVRVFDFLEPDSENYLLLDIELVEALQNMLLSAKALCAHNAMFETSHLQNVFKAHFGVTQSLNILCTLIGFRTILCTSLGDDLKTVEATLASVSVAYTGFKPPKESISHSDWGIPGAFTKQQLLYCAWDAVVPRVLIKYHILPKIIELNQEHVYQLYCQAQEPIAAMHYRGFGFDSDTHDILIERWTGIRDTLSDKIIHILNKPLFSDMSVSDYETVVLDKVLKRDRDYIRTLMVSLNTKSDIVDVSAVISDVNLLKRKALDETRPESETKVLKRVIKNLDALILSPNSSKDKNRYIEMMYPDIDWPVSEKSGLRKTDKHTIIDLIPTDPFACILSEHSKYYKLASTYGDGLKKYMYGEGSVKTVYPQFSLAYTATGRMSSFSPNVQNMPRDPDIRKLFVPKEKGNVLVCADFSQVEVRVAAYLSNDSVMLEAYNEGKDLHKITASAMSGKSLDEVTKEDRQGAKSVLFGTIFGAGANTLKTYAHRTYGVDMSDEEAQYNVKVFRDTYPEYRQWQIRVSSDAEESLIAHTPMGKVRALPEDGYYTRSMNTPIQGGAGEIMLLSLVKIQDALSDSDVEAYLCNVVHDEVIVECRKGDVEEVSSIIETCMKEAFLEILPGGPVSGLVEANHGLTWHDAK